MQRHRLPRITAFLGALFASVLLAGVAVVTLTTSAAAAPRHGATGLHDGMMPAGSPDAATSGTALPNVARPNGTLGGQAVAAGVPGAQTGVDVSHHQNDAGPLDWSQVAASGQKFAIVKATELYTDSNGQPTLFTDPDLQANVTGARAAGLMVGAYAFAHPENSPTVQADDFAAAISGLLGAGGLPPVLDLEANGGLSPAQLASWTQAFLDRLQADTGIVPMIYTGPNFWQDSMGGNAGFGHYPLWEANWTTAAAPAAIAGWSAYSLWQYSDSGAVSGITGVVDLDVSNGPVANLAAVQASQSDISPVGVAAVHTTPGSVLAVVRGTDSALWVTTAINGVFGGYQKIPSVATSAPAVTTADGKRIDIFVRGTDWSLWHTALTVDSTGRPASLAPWDNLGGVITTAPTAASSGSGRLLVTARGNDGSLWSRTWYAGGWQPWTADGGTAVAAPAVDVVDANTYRAQVVHSDGVVWTGRFSASTGALITNWQPTASSSSVAPGASAVSWTAMSIRASGYGSGSGIQQVWANGRVLNLGGAVTSGLAMAEAGTTTVWTFARGTDNALWANVSTGSTSTWSKVGGALA